MERQGTMHPDRMGKSKWVKLQPWYYTHKRKRARRSARTLAIKVNQADEGTPCADS